MIEEQNTDKLNEQDNKIITAVILTILCLASVSSAFLLGYSIKKNSFIVETTPISNCEIEQQKVFVTVNHTIIEKENKTLHKYILRPEK